MSDWGLYGEDGIQVADADFKFPFMLRFKPTGEISFPDEYVNDWKDDLMSIPAGTTLYQVYALDEPEVGYLTKIEAILSYHICIRTMN